MTKILLGPAGTPAKSTLDGLAEIQKLGLQAMEVQFSHGINMSLDLARRIGEENKRAGISLSVHAPYFINLASADKKKVEESRKRIIDSCERAALMGSRTVVFHPGFYSLGEKSFDAVETAIADIKNHIEKKKWEVELAPETTGKVNQFGQLDELERIVKKVRCGVCIDFSHIYARNRGKINYAEVLDWRLSRSQKSCCAGSRT
ncbi:MAG: TIM barrel protein [Candidatus Aenigmarchaeota archaeon]|nr:TIM barrel protein [Candidatus Aenigmarchaeota archaeon]